MVMDKYMRFGTYHICKQQGLRRVFTESPEPSLLPYTNYGNSGRYKAQTQIEAF